MRKPVATLLALATGGVLAAPAAAGAQSPACTPWESRTVVSGLGGRVENLEPDVRGNVFVSLSDGDRVVRVAPDGGTTPVAERIESPGGMRVRWPFLYVNTDNALPSALAGSTNGTIERIDLRTGARSTYARGLTAPNGLVLLADGDALVSRAIGSGTGVTRVDAADPSRPQTNWARVDETNGLALDAAGRWLYAAMTFTADSRIVRIDVADPTKVEDVARLSDPGAPKGVDDLAIDAAGVLYLAANGSGEVLRLDPRSGDACAIASGIRQPSSVRISCTGPERLYVTAFDGALRELRPPPGGPAVAPSPACDRTAPGAPGAGAQTPPAGGPQSRACTSRRAFRVRTRRAPRGDRLVAARITLDGRRLRVRRRAGRFEARVDLRGRAAGRAELRIVARTRAGRTLRERRTYRTCAAPATSAT